MASKKPTKTVEKGGVKKAATASAKKAVTALKKRPIEKKTKVRTSVRFRRPVTLKLPRNPKCPTKAVHRMPKMDHFTIVKGCLMTESAMRKVEELNTITFRCDSRANKRQIKDAIKAIYNIKVLKVNTLIRPDGDKKAFVRLPAEQDAIHVANKIGIL